MLPIIKNQFRKDRCYFKTLCDANLLLNSNDSHHIEKIHIFIYPTSSHLIELELSESK